MIKKIARTILFVIIFIVILPQTAPFRRVSESNHSGNFGNIIINAFNLATGALNFVINGIRTAFEDELDDTAIKDWDVYDFIVIGAGSAGCAVASRLSEVRNVSVLLIEAGIAENILMSIPLTTLYLQLSNAINWSYKMEYSPNYCRGMQGQRCRMPRGKVMGGSSVLNLMISTRASHQDYDHWLEMGCEGWAWKDVYPIFKQMENFEVQGEEIEEEYHGTGGLVNIAYPPYHTPASAAFLEAGKERGFKVVDYDGKEMIGYSFTHGTVKDGSRFSANRAYLYPAKHRPNLFLTKQTHADRILIDRQTKRAYGVVVTKNGKKIHLIARKEVIVSAGAINSPKILMLSGIGPTAHLEQMKIRVIKDAPVGHNLVDHIAYWGLNFYSNDSTTILVRDMFKLASSTIPDYLRKREGPLTCTGGIEAASFLNVDDLSIRTGWPNMELIMTGASLSSAPFAYRSLGIVDRLHEEFFKPDFHKESFMILPTLLRPKSVGMVLLKSKNPKLDPRIIPNYFTDPDDMRRMILGIREAIALTKTQAMQKIGAHLSPTPVPGCANFTMDSDEYWDCAVRTFADTLYHPAGTCKMGSRNDHTAVVDPRLKVIGIDGLRVADLSITPTIPSGHTQIPAMMIGEKLSQMVKEDWNLI